jgi:hypothetical protein
MSAEKQGEAFTDCLNDALEGTYKLCLGSKSFEKAGIKCQDKVLAEKCEKRIKDEAKLPPKERTVFQFGVPGTSIIEQDVESDCESGGDEYPSDDSGSDRDYDESGSDVD